MKKLVALTCATILTLGTASAFADDVRIDEAEALVSNGTIQSFEKLNAAALAARAGTITDTDLEESAGNYVYEVEIRDAQGVEWDLHMDATNAEVLKIEQDD
ncbi:PepSY domain-containing protein [uncultured Halopseudomonas sp.]|uniref:PepSY domain-containing protein n=1 Tax=uncultured Halopseudomonas sp. TaxID=2901193 RepID=UPI0030EE0E07|tara:strand:- start:33051 stop:33356 length:306 start_codon:yes stop_codon:yes gene_type:complete